MVHPSAQTQFLVWSNTTVLNVTVDSRRLASGRRLHGPGCLSSPAPITSRHRTIVENHLKSFKARPFDLDLLRRVLHPKISMGRNWLLPTPQGDNEMIRLGNRHWHFTHRDIKRCDTRIERGLRNDATGTPNEKTNDCGYEYNDGEIFWMAKFNRPINEQRR